MPGQAARRDAESVYVPATPATKRQSRHQAREGADPGGDSGSPSDKVGMSVYVRRRKLSSAHADIYLEYIPSYACILCTE